MEYSICSMPVFGLVLCYLNVFFMESVQDCAPPFIPKNGYIEETQPKYSEGDKVTYKCNKGFWLLGNDNRTCQKNATWTGQMPFCDGVLQLSAVGNSGPETLTHGDFNTLIDNDLTTCIQLYQKGEILWFSLAFIQLVTGVRIYLPAGEHSFDVKIAIHGPLKICGTYIGMLGNSTWVILPCKEETEGYFVEIHGSNKTGSVHVCEVEVYGNDKLSCHDPPKEVPVPNGEVIVDRRTAVMKCDAETNKIVSYGICKGRKWEMYWTPNCSAENVDEKGNREKTQCAPPFIPKHGYVEEPHTTYSAGDEITYHCNEGFWLLGDGNRTCQRNAKWTGRMPFCDRLLPHSYPKVLVTEKSKPDFRTLLDNQLTTCIELYERRQVIVLSLGSKKVVTAVRIYVPPGGFRISIETLRQSTEWTCAVYTGLLYTPTWLNFSCMDITTADSIKIENYIQYIAPESWQICAVEVYGDDDLSCQHPPEEVSVPNRDVIVDRKSAEMKCDAGSNKYYSYGVCKEGKWETNRTLNCRKGNDEEKPDHKRSAIIASCVTIAVFTLGCCSGILLYIRKKRQNSAVVVVNPEEHPSCSGTAYSDCPEEDEYATINYENIPRVTYENISVVFQSK